MHSSIQTPYGVNLPYSCHPRTVFLKHTSTHTCTYRLARKVTGFVESSLLPHIVLCLVLGDSHIEKSFTRPFNYSSYSDLSCWLLLSPCLLFIIFIFPYPLLFDGIYHAGSNVPSDFTLWTVYYSNHFSAI